MIETSAPNPVPAAADSLARGMSDVVWVRRGTPLLTYVLGMLGALPVIALATALVAVPRGVRTPSLCVALLGYGAIILGFAGAVHWGIALATGRASGRARLWARWRLLLGVCPALWGWVSMLVGVLSDAGTGLVLLMIGFAATAAAEAVAVRRSGLSSGYMSMRWLLTVVVEACLLAATLSLLV